MAAGLLIYRSKSAVERGRLLLEESYTCSQTIWEIRNCEWPGLVPGRGRVTRWTNHISVAKYDEQNILSGKG